MQPDVVLGDIDCACVHNICICRGTRITEGVRIKKNTNKTKMFRREFYTVAFFEASSSFCWFFCPLFLSFFFTPSPQHKRSLYAYLQAALNSSSLAACCIRIGCVHIEAAARW